MLFEIDIAYRKLYTALEIDGHHLIKNSAVHDFISQKTAIMIGISTMENIQKLYVSLQPMLSTVLLVFPYSHAR
jgi:hypothetical protein